MTNSHYESVVTQRGSLASGEFVFIYQYMHAHRQEHVTSAIFNMSVFAFLPKQSTISSDTPSHPSGTEDKEIINMHLHK